MNHKRHPHPHTTKLITLALIPLLATTSIHAQVQDPYLNAQTTTQDDIYGTSRSVAMGGALGALGADISTISANPAGTAIMSGTTATITAGAIWLSNASQATRRGFGDIQATFDQIGIVTTLNTKGKIHNVSLAFNYQKRQNYLAAHFSNADSNTSWAHQLHNMSQYALTTPYDPTIYFDANRYGVIAIENDQWYTKTHSHNTIGETTGSINGYDINLSTNIQDRYYLGLTLGFDQVLLDNYIDYQEYRSDKDDPNINHDFGFVNHQHIRGTGVNLKIGTIIRPFADTPLRFGLTIETPTWYSLKYHDSQSVITHFYDHKDQLIYDPQHSYEHYNQTDNYTTYRLVTPWKFRLQAGCTHSNTIAWGAEYQYATHTTYHPHVLTGQHTLRAGFEIRPLSWLSLRAGYNYISSIHRPQAYWNPVEINPNLSPRENDLAVDYPTSLQYTNLSDTHIYTAGIGFRYKRLTADIAYKYRHQTGQHHAYYSVDTQGQPIETPGTKINLTRQQLTATLGIKF